LPGTKRRLTLNIMSVKTECQPTLLHLVMQNTASASITIVVNGEERAMAQGDTIAVLVGSLGLDPERLAVELDRKIVKRADWSATVLAPGSEVEIVQFVGGG
jgi:sulfur carrier protein